MTLIPSLLCALAVAVVVSFLLMPWGVALAISAVLALGFGLFATWYHADDKPVFAPFEEGRVTFKTVVLNFFADVAEFAHVKQLFGWLRRLWAFWGPWLTNTVLAAVVALDAFIFSQPQLMGAIQGTAGGGGWALLFLLHFAAARAVRGAPERIPAPGV